MQPTLAQDIEKFLYTHAQNMPFKQQLMAIVRMWEHAYLERIAELEKADNAGNKMADEGGQRYDDF